MIRARIPAIVVAWVVVVTPVISAQQTPGASASRSVPIPGVSTGHEPDRGHPTGRYHR